jgi:hypothetical protein
MPALGSVPVPVPVRAPELGWAPGLPAWLPVRQVLLPPQVRVPQLPGAVPPVLAQRVLAPALQLQALRRAALARARAQVSARVRVRRRQALQQLALPALPAGALAVRLALLVRRWPGPGRARPAHRYQVVPGLVLARAF